MPVEEADADEGEAQAPRGLDVVAGQHAGAPRVLGQGGVDAELGREVGDGAQGKVGPLGEPAGPAQVVVEVVAHLVHEGQEAPVPGQGLQALLGDHAEEAHRVPSGGLPELGVRPPEQVDGTRVPAPTEVHRDLPQLREGLGKLGSNGEAVQCSRHSAHSLGVTVSKPSRHAEFIAPGA